MKLNEIKFKLLTCKIPKSKLLQRESQTFVNNYILLNFNQCFYSIYIHFYNKKLLKQQ